MKRHEIWGDIASVQIPYYFNSYASYYGETEEQKKLPTNEEITKAMELTRGLIGEQIAISIFEMRKEKEHETRTTEKGNK